MSIVKGIHNYNMRGPEDDDDIDDSTSPGSADPWSNDNDGYGTDTNGGAIWQIKQDGSGFYTAPFSHLHNRRKLFEQISQRLPQIGVVLFNVAISCS